MNKNELYKTLSVSFTIISSVLIITNAITAIIETQTKSKYEHKKRWIVSFTILGVAAAIAASIESIVKLKSS